MKFYVFSHGIWVALLPNQTERANGQKGGEYRVVGCLEAT